MAEAAVNSVIRTLSGLLLQEIQLLGSVKQGIENITRELESIKSLLKDADKRAAQEEEEEGAGSNEGVKTWVKQLKEEAFQIEDVMDMYTMKVARLSCGKEGYEITFGKLTGFWMVEGFFQCNNHLPCEYAVEEYLKELIDRSKLPESFMITLVRKFKLLKILELEDAPINSLPDGVGKLFHLHYLSLKNTNVKELPKSMGMLLNLETLDLKWTPLFEFLVEIKHLKKLQNLIFRRLDFKGPSLDAVKIQVGFGTLRRLQRLLSVHINSEALNELMMLTQLRRLSINLTPRDVKNLFGIVKNMKNLERLSVLRLTSGEEIVDSESVDSPPQCLEQLDLAMYIKKVSVWICKLENLVRLQLKLVGSTNDSMRVLQALPNLLVFILIVRDCDEELHLIESWFPKLQQLRLHNFTKLKWMIIEKGAMPSLTELLIGPSPSLKEISIGIEHLRNLKILMFHIMLKDVFYMIKNDNWEKLTNHIPQIHASFRQTIKKYNFFTSTYLSSLSAEDFEKLLKDIEYK
ncbi:disease resistance protein RPM1-like [Mangifera indica]|uniref:disease resistance protein RPM1-like n=1 Tax=Mangifera indica TaxID=29780 RepID=UPI001CF941AA|nr:disease resistance protein RPM1-like [Mangifera indica]